MPRRQIPSYDEANNYLRSDHPKRLSKESAFRLGRGEDLEKLSLDLDEKPNFYRGERVVRIKEGDYVEIKKSFSQELNKLKAKGLPNLFVVTGIQEDVHGNRILAIKNEQDHKYRLRGKENNYELAKNENKRSGT